jgi:dihydrofolate reductase
MRKVILQEFVTLDGFAADENGGTDFVPETNQGDQTLVRDQTKMLETVDTMMLGRKTYEMFAEFWPNVTEGDEKDFADKLNSMHKIVFSNTLETAPWGDWEAARVVNGRAEDEVPRLKEEPGKDIVIWGSLSLAQSLINEGLIDEYRLVTCPIFLGGGRPPFDQVDSLGLKLVEAKPFEQGSVQLKYTPEPAASSEKTKQASQGS